MFEEIDGVVIPAKTEVYLSPHRSRAIVPSVPRMPRKHERIWRNTLMSEAVIVSTARTPIGN
jgi:hypothetical protein